MIGKFFAQGKPSLLDTYDYAMHGRIFSYEHKAGLEVEIVASFGGLLMSLKGDQRYQTDKNVVQVLANSGAHLGES